MNSPAASLVPADSVNAALDVPTPMESVDEWAAVSVSSLGHVLCHTAELVFTGVMLAVMAEFQLPPEQGTALALLGYFLMGAGALPVGVWIDCWGAGRVLWVYYLAVAASSLLVALSTNIWTLFAALTLLGLALSIYHPAGLVLLVNVRARGRALGINGVAGSIGVALGPMLGLFATALGHWRLAYVVVAVLSLAAAVWMRRPGRAAVMLKPTYAAETPAAPAERSRWAVYLPLFLMMGAMTIGGFNYRCFVTALPTYLAEGDENKDVVANEEPAGAAVAETPAKGKLIQGGIFVTLIMIVGGVGQYIGGWGCDRFGARFVYFMLIALYAPALFVLGSLHGMSLAVAVACLAAFCQFALQPVENVFLADYSTERRRGLSYAAKFSLTFGVGALGTVAVGYLWEHYTLGATFYLIGGTSLVMGLLLFLAVALSPRDCRAALASGQPDPRASVPASSCRSSPRR